LLANFGGNASGPLFGQARFSIDPVMPSDPSGGATGTGGEPVDNGNYGGLWWNAPAGSESGWGLNFAHQGDVIFATWFTYDRAGKPWWLSMTANKAGPGTYSGTLYETSGPSFAAAFESRTVAYAPVGQATLKFTDANNAQFSYLVDGVSQSKTIMREVFADSVPTCIFGISSNLAAARNYQDLWWAAPAGSESGWGLNIAHQANTIFATWFTYNSDGSPTWMSVTASNVAPGVYAGALYESIGPSFDSTPFDPASVTRIEVGSATLTFLDGESAIFSYSVMTRSLVAKAATLGQQAQPAYVTQSKQITRQVFRAPGTLCA
jgi:hypothetical protein